MKNRPGMLISVVDDGGIAQLVDLHGLPQYYVASAEPLFGGCGKMRLLALYDRIISRSPLL